MGHNLDLVKVFIFTSAEVFNICLQYESNSKRVCRTQDYFRLITNIPSSCGCCREEEDSMRFTWLKNKAHNR